MSASSKAAVSTLLNVLQNTTYQPDAPRKGAGPSYAFDTTTPWDHSKLDYSDVEFIMTTLPQSQDAAIHADGEAECLCTGWFKRKVLSTPGFPSPIVHPPKNVYRVQEAPGSGLGVFATDDIKAGDLIVAERPLLVKMAMIPMTHDKGMSQKDVVREGLVDLEKNMEILCSRMPPMKLAIYEALHNSHLMDGSGPLTGIWRTNGFDVGVRDPTLAKGQEGDSAYSCVGAIGSRFNHSCSPNAVYQFEMSSFAMEFYAVRPIEKGEEIFVAYCALLVSAADRQSALKSYGFTCSCPACRDSQESDRERPRVVNALLPKTSQGVKHAEAVLAAFEATGLQVKSRYIELLRRVAQINRKHSNKERADELDSLADKVTVAQVGREPQRADSEPTQVHKNRIFNSAEDMLHFIMQHGNPTERANMLKAFMQIQHPSSSNSTKITGPDGKEVTVQASDIIPVSSGF